MTDRSCVGQVNDSPSIRRRLFLWLLGEVKNAGSDIVFASDSL